MAEACITVKNLTMAYGDFVIQRDLDFTIDRGDIFIIMGGSGCGKSTLLQHMIGLRSPTKGDIFYGTKSLSQSRPQDRKRILQQIGVLFQSGALLSSMTLAENVALPITEASDLPPRRVREIVSYKLALVGLAGFEDFYPSEISGGMQKRAGLARAMALDPEILFFDEPSAGLDPISAKLLDDLILSLRNSLNATVIGRIQAMAVHPPWFWRWRFRPGGSHHSVEWPFRPETLPCVATAAFFAALLHFLHADPCALLIAIALAFGTESRS